jgi:7,8-dihydropterin-6-yl-methyl-4-(beta-D-ribofuranosyl)aminobenzene 5'-phosphate synthase
MKIIILCENNTSAIYAEKNILSEWGFSAFLQTKTANILFDTGKTDVYKNNAEILGIDLDKTDFIILSHHHFDHAKGLISHNFKTKKKLIIHPQILEKISTDDSKKFKDDFKIITSTTPLEFSPDIFYLGEIPRKNDFEQGTHKGEKMLDDSAIAIKSKNGLVVLTGCSHSGICNICEYAKKITGQKLYAVIGGFHLFKKNPTVIDKTIEYFKTENPERLYPMHCIDLPTLSRFYSEFGIQKLSTGDAIELDD